MDSHGNKDEEQEETHAQRRVSTCSHELLSSRWWHVTMTTISTELALLFFGYIKPCGGRVKVCKGYSNKHNDEETSGGNVVEITNEMTNVNDSLGCKHVDGN